MEFENKEVKGLLDSGASVSVVIEDLVEELPILPTRINLKTANSSFLDVIGYVNIEYTFRGKKRAVPTIVVRECAHELILGMNFWETFGLTIDDSDDNPGIVLYISSSTNVIYWDRD